MSLNSALSQQYLPEVQALLQLLEKYMAQWTGAPTVEQKLLIEADAVVTFERLLQLHTFANEVQAGSHPEFLEMNRVYGDLWFLLEMNSAKAQSLGEMFLKRFNSQQLALLELTSLMKRIRQKRAALTLWTRDQAKYVLAEKFLNFDYLDTKFTSLTECDVDTNQGVLTLPVKNRTKLVPSGARIGGTSNGNPGNSDQEVQTNNTNPKFAINTDPTNWFEYERLDTGPADLTMIVEFSQPEVINQIAINPVNLGVSLSYEVIDITFTISAGAEVSIHDLVSSAFDADFFTVKSSGNDTTWVMSFLPVEATSVSLKFRQRQPYQISMSSSDNRTVLRDRYAIAIKSIYFYRIEYENTGGINSKSLDIPGGLYAAVSFADYWPRNDNLFVSQLEVSTNDGETWSALDNNPLDGVTHLMQGGETSFLWRLSLERNDFAFQNLTSFLKTDNPILETKSLLRSVSRFQSPSSIVLPEAPMDGKVFAIQPQIARRGDKFAGILIGQGGGRATSFDLPFSLLKRGILPSQVRFFVAKREYDYVEDNTQVGANQWSFSDDYREVIFGSALPEGSDVTMVLDEEVLSIEERSDGYYHQMKLLFDPDKDNIRVKYLPRNPQRTTVLLPRDRKVIDLRVTNILSDSFKVSSDTGDTYVEVFSRAEVLDGGAKEYYVDYKNGVLYLDQESAADTLRVSFLHQTEKEVSPKDFDVVIVDNIPWGIRIRKSAFEAQSYTDTVGQAQGKVIDPIAGTYGVRTDHFSGASNAITLTYDCIVQGTVAVSDNLVNTDVAPEEVAFIDGKSEFLGLIPMNTERTSAIDPAVGEEYVNFNLSAGALWYTGYDILFSDGTVFANLVSSASLARNGSVGDYFVDSSGVVTVNVGVNGSLPSDISINYYYRDPAFDPANKYSVDYTNGVLYTYKDLVDGATIEYRAACYRASYDIASEIPTQSYNQEDNSISIRTEKLHPINNLVKVIWTEATPVSDLAELKNFFTPLIYTLAFRFN